MAEAVGGGAEALVGRSGQGPTRREKQTLQRAKETPALLRSGQPRERGKAAKVCPSPNAPRALLEKLALGP